MNPGDKEAFRTLKGYERSENSQMTPAMEDYLEMICRLLAARGHVRVKDLANELHVKPSSVSKMVDKLKILDMVACEKYGDLRLTETGAELGRYLLHRHEVLHRFFCLVNNSDNELAQTEKVEHFIRRDTVNGLEQAICLLEASKLS